MKICKVDGCEKKVNCWGYCGMHYYRVKKYGEPGPVETFISIKDKPLVCQFEGCNNTIIHAKGLCRKCYNRQYVSPNKCSVEGCDNPLYANGYCNMHNLRAKKYNGEVGSAEPLKNAAGEGTLDANGYRAITHPVSKKRVLEHRYVMEEHLGRKLFPGE